MKTSKYYFDKFFIIYVMYSSLVANFYMIIPTLKNNENFTFFLSAIFIGPLLLMFLLRLKYVKLLPIAILLLVFLGFLISSLRTINTNEVNKFLTIGAFRTIWIWPIVYSIETDPSLRVHQLTKAAFIIVSIKTILNLAGFYSSDDYMEFGYSMTLWCCFCIQAIFTDKEIKNKKYLVLICYLSCAAAILFGNRGVILVLLVFYIYAFQKYHSKRITLKTGILFLLFGIIIFMFIIFKEDINIYIARKINSRTYQLLISQEISNLSGRTNIWLEGWNAVKAKPLFGNGIGYDRVIIGTYVHNILIELLVDFGFLIGFPIFISIIVIGVQILFFSSKKDWVLLFAPFYISSIVQLMISGSLYQNSSFFSAIIIAAVSSYSPPPNLTVSRHTSFPKHLTRIRQ
nr:O-antigen ligase family protein [uncultured Sphaerochaeta sp.]